MRLYLAACPLPPLPRAEARQEASLAARKSLFALLHAAGIQKSAADLATTPEGRPFLLHSPTLDFSISHTSEAAFCLLAVDDGSAASPRVGIDAEHLAFPQEKAIRLAERFFAPEELRLFRDSGQTAEAFLKIFTAKEAYAKYDGKGLAKTHKIDTVCPLFAKNHQASIRHTFYRDHIIALCLPQNAADAEITFREL